MAITNVWWDGGGYDLHLLLGETSQPLNQKLAIERESGGSITTFFGNNLPPGVTVQFVGEFKGTPPVHGVKRLDSSTGEIEIDGVLPATRLHNFIVYAEVSESGGNPFEPEPQIRVHIHESIQKIWLTPTTLTLYHGTTNQQFTVLAEFDDGTNGDITGRSGLAYTSSQPGNVTVDTDSGKLVSVQSNQSSDITVTFGPLPAPPDLMSTAKVNTKPSLAQPRTITRVRDIGPVAFNTKVNILFIPDGFQDSEKGLFRQLIDHIVDKLQTNRHTFPYNELKDSIDYWRLEDADFIPSAEQNVSVLAEMDILGRRSMRGKLAPFPVKPRSNAPRWTLENLVYMVGLPVSADATKSRTTKLAEWGTLYDGITASKISTRLFERWRAIADRKLINERDTAFGIAINDHPRVDRDEDRVVSFHERRTTSSQFTAFLEQLRHGGTTVGTTWTTRKDKGLVCVIARSERTGGAQFEALFTSTLGRSVEDRLQAASGGRRGIDLVPMSLARGGRLRTLHPEVAHECAHAFRYGDKIILEDEYGGGFNFPTHLASTLASVGNVQPASEIILSPPQAGLDANKIKWTWPRVKAAGVLTGNPLPVDVSFVLTLKAGHASAFNLNDLVRLRKREFIGSTNAFSGRCKVNLIFELGDNIQITPEPGTVINGADFPEGSLLIATVPGTPTPPAPVGDDLSLVAPIILNHIGTSNGPLNAPPNNPTRACAAASSSVSVMTPTNLPGGLPPRRPRNKANIVGIYEGGARYDCDIYHPAGLCIMRTLTRGRRTARFCHVCRYLIVDRVNPTKHKELDTIYANQYPEP